MTDQGRQARPLDPSRARAPRRQVRAGGARPLYFDDIVDSAERIWDQLDNYKEVVDGLESTNESVLSHRQNDVLRVLTSFSVIVLPLTLISGIFGMNVDFPGFSTPAAFWLIVVLMLAVMVGMVGFFRHKRWL